MSAPIRLDASICLAIVILTGPVWANKVFVSNEKGNSVTVIDSETWQVTDEFPAGNRPRGIGLSPDGKVLYVCASDDDTIRVFDTETYAELWTLPSGPDPELFAIHRDGKLLYVANEDDNLVTVVDTEAPVASVIVTSSAPRLSSACSRVRGPMIGLVTPG